MLGASTEAGASLGRERVTPARGRTFPLVPVRRFAGQPGGMQRSLRRGDGDEVVGSRPYRPGDPVSTIDWATSARLSAARNSDVFVVQEHFAAETPRVAVVADPRPAMSLYAPPFPWLDKAAAGAAVSDLIARSADNKLWLVPGTGSRLGARRLLSGSWGGFDLPGEAGRVGPR